jgi:hypothetical protein
LVTGTVVVCVVVAGIVVVTCIVVVNVVVIAVSVVRVVVSAHRPLGDMSPGGLTSAGLATVL